MSLEIKDLEVKEVIDIKPANEQLFEVTKNGITMMYTTNYRCLPNHEILSSMQKNGGYKFRVNGRNVTLKRLREIIKYIEDNEEATSSD